MYATTVRQIIKNAVEHQGGQFYKVGSTWHISKIPSPETVISTIFNALPVDFKIERGVNITGFIWVKIWASLNADFSVISLNFDNKEVD